MNMLPGTLEAHPLEEDTRVSDWVQLDVTNRRGLLYLLDQPEAFGVSQNDVLTLAEEGLIWDERLFGKYELRVRKDE